MLHLNKVQKEDHLYAAFSYFDKDGSGYITKDELQQACQQFGLKDDHLDDIIREADRNNVMDPNFLTPCFSHNFYTTSLYLFHHIIYHIFIFSLLFFFPFYLSLDYVPLTDTPLKCERIYRGCPCFLLLHDNIYFLVFFI